MVASAGRIMVEHVLTLSLPETAPIHLPLHWTSGVVIVPTVSTAPVGHVRYQEVDVEHERSIPVFTEELDCPSGTKRRTAVLSRQLHDLAPTKPPSDLGVGRYRFGRCGSRAAGTLYFSTAGTHTLNQSFSLSMLPADP